MLGRRLYAVNVWNVPDLGYLHTVLFKYLHLQGFKANDALQLLQQLMRSFVASTELGRCAIVRIGLVKIG